MNIKLAAASAGVLLVAGIGAGSLLPSSTPAAARDRGDVVSVASTQRVPTCDPDAAITQYDRRDALAADTVAFAPTAKYSLVAGEVFDGGDLVDGVASISLKTGPIADCLTELGAVDIRLAGASLAGVREVDIDGVEAWIDGAGLHFRTTAEWVTAAGVRSPAELIIQRADGELLRGSVAAQIDE